MADGATATAAAGSPVGAGVVGAPASASIGDAVAAGVHVAVGAAVWETIRVSVMIVSITTARRGAANATSTPITMAAEELRRRRAGEVLGRTFINMCDQRSGRPTRNRPRCIYTQLWPLGL